MSKKWKTAPWSIRLIFLYWLLPGVMLFAVFSYLIIMILLTEGNFMWKILYSMEAEEFKRMPIATLIEWSFTIMSLFGAYYGWRLLQGCGMARSFLEIFSWLLIVYSIALVVFPEIKYLELHTTPSDINDSPIIWTIIAWLFVLVEAVVLFFLRKESVKNYANIF